MKRGITGGGYSTTGLAWRIGATAGLLGLCVLSTVRGASGAFDAASLPVATLTGQNGMISGTTRVMGDHFLLYNGTRLESMTQSMEVNFERGGSMLLCPRSQLQILTANQNAGMMLAFQSGGSQQPFPLRMGDEVITPDWRVELTSDARQGDMGVVQVVTNRHGDLCLQGTSQMGAFFKVTQLIGDGSFRVAGGQSERFSDGRMETSATDGCGCSAQFEAKADPIAPMGPSVPGFDPKPPSNPTLVPAGAVSEIASAESSRMQAANATRFSPSSPVPAVQPPGPAYMNASAVKSKARRRPQDVAGYVSSFVHFVFGR